MRRYVLKRLLQIVLTLYVYITLVFFILEAQPGDFASFYTLNPNLDPSVVEAIRKQFGLDKPLPQRYLAYVLNFSAGNFGISFSEYPRPVFDILKERLPRTVVLFLTATIISFYMGFVLGKLIAWRRGKVIEYVSTVGGVTLFTIFTPWFALLLIWAFAFKLGWFPISKFITIEKWLGTSENFSNTVFGYILAAMLILSFLALAVFIIIRQLQSPLTRKAVGLTAPIFTMAAMSWFLGATQVGYFARDILYHMVLPIVVLTSISFGGTMLLMRSAMLETIREDYVLAARAKGLADKAVRDKHVARNALLPLVTSFVFSLAFAVDGGVITETIFSWPGMGLTLLNAVLANDYPLAIGALVLVGVFALIAHLIADILYAYLDPRIRYD